MTTEVKISELPAASSANSAMQFETNDSGTSKRVTADQLSSYITAGFSVDPNVTTKGLYEHANTINVAYSITSGNNALAAGPVTIGSSGSVTVPSGSTWVIV